MEFGRRKKMFSRTLKVNRVRVTLYLSGEVKTADLNVVEGITEAEIALELVMAGFSDGFKILEVEVLSTKEVTVKCSMQDFFRNNYEEEEEK